MSNGENKLYSCFNKYKEIKMTLIQILQKIRSTFYTKSQIDSMGGGNSLDTTIKAKARSVNGINADANGDVNILDLVHPIGSLYWSKNPTDPSVLFGGTWKRIKDTFILACGDTYSIGSTGGEASHTLTVDEMPTHNHSASTNTQGDHTHGAWTDSQGDHTHGAWTDTQGNHCHGLYGRSWGWGQSDATESIQASTQSGYWGNNAASSRPENAGTGWGGSHAHNVGMNSAGGHTHNVGMNSAGGHAHTVTVNNSGAGAAHNNMPPYITYYCWERTA